MKFSLPLPSHENRIKPESQVSSFSSSQTSGPARFTSTLFFSVNSFGSVCVCYKFISEKFRISCHFLQHTHRVMGLIPKIPVSSDSRIDMMTLFVILASRITKSFHVSAPAYELVSEALKHITFISYSSKLCSPKKHLLALRNVSVYQI